MPVLQRTPDHIDAYLDGLAAGMQLAEAYQEENTRPRFQLTRTTRRLVLLVLLISLAGWLYGGLELLGIAPAPVAPAATSHLRPCTTEDDPGPCHWDAQHQGNGRGQSFTTMSLAAHASKPHTLPRWVHWHTIKTSECGKDHAAIVVYPSTGGTSALVCKSGVVETS